MSRQPAGGPRSEHTTPQLSPIHSQFPIMDSHRRTSPREGHMNPPVSLPPLRHLSSTPPTPSSQRHPDPFRAILNPQAELMDQHRDRRRSGSHVESPSPIETQNSQSLPSISRPTSVDSTQEDLMPPRPFQRPLPRAGLSPKSSRVQRTENFGRPTGTIDAHQQPFLTASSRPSESLTTQSSLPTPPIQTRITYFPPTPTVIPIPPNPMHQEVRRTSVGFPMSGSASPSAQYSPYSQPASIESSQYESSNAPQYLLNHSNVHMHDSRMSAGPLDSERSMIPMAPSGQSSIQLMTIKSQQGHPVQIPVDVQAASKVADEKRRRNAGASARFRARRKEKEREASQSISRLEQQLRDALEDAEYYRTERDYFKSIVFQQPHPERHYARPPSPRLRRLSAPSRALSSPRGGSVDSYGDYEDDYRESERNVRRRTSNYHVPSGPSATDMNSLGPPSHSSSGAALTAVHSAGPQNGPEPHSHTMGYREQPTVSALQHPHPERPVYRESFSVEHARYENRSWAPGQLPAREN